MVQALGGGPLCGGRLQDPVGTSPWRGQRIKGGNLKKVFSGAFTLKPGNSTPKGHKSWALFWTKQKPLLLWVAPLLACGKAMGPCWDAMFNHTTEGAW